MPQIQLQGSQVDEANLDMSVVDGSVLTDVNAASLDGFTIHNGVNGILQLDGAQRIPNVDGSLITNLAPFDGNSYGFKDDNPVRVVNVTGDTMTGPLILEHAFPELKFSETDASVDNKVWVVQANNESLNVGARSDAGAGGGSFFSFERDGADVTIFAGKKSAVTWFEIDNLNKKITTTETPVDDDELTRKDYVDDTTVALDGSHTMTGMLDINSDGTLTITSVTDTHNFTGFDVHWINGNQALSLTKNFTSNTATIYNSDNTGAVLGGIILDINGDVRSLVTPSLASGNCFTHKTYVDTEVGTKQTNLRDVGSFEFNTNGSGDRNTLIDFHSSDDASQSDYSARLIRATGVDGDFTLSSRGAGNVVIVSGVGAGSGTLRVFNSGNVTVSASAPSAINHLTRKDYVDDNFVDLTTIQTISGGKTFSDSRTNLSHDSAQLTFDAQTAPDGYGTHRITCNDGGGNWNFRSGNYYSSGTVSTTAGDGAIHMSFGTDGQAGTWSILTASAVSVSPGDAMTMRNNILASYDNVTFSAAMPQLRWARDPAHIDDLTRKSYVDDNFVSLTGDTINGSLTLTQSDGTLALDVTATEILGGTLNDVVILDRVQGRVTNSIKFTNWLRRNANGGDWNTAVWHSAISVDTSFDTPGVDTRCWEERDPSTGAFKFGNGGTTYLTVDDTITTHSDFTVNGQLRADIGTVALPGVTFSGDNNTGIYQTVANGNHLKFATAGVLRFEVETNGTLNVAGTSNYETLVTADDDIPNKKYVDDNFLGISAKAADSSLLNNAVESTLNTIHTIVKRDASGDINLRLLRQQYTGLATSPNYFLTQNAVGTGDNYARPASIAQVRTSLGTMNSTNALDSSTTTVNVSSASAPSSGQVLTATSSTAATWQAISGFVDLSSTQTVAGLKTFSNTLSMNANISFNTNLQILNSGGSLASPSYAFSGDGNTGMTQNGSTENIHLVTNGVSRLQIESNGTLNVAGTTNYETLVTSDDDIPNKKYVDDIATAAATARNVIINGNFDIWQRDVSFSAAANNQYTADRWRYIKSGATVHTVLQSTDTPTIGESGMNANYSIQLDVTTADATIVAGDYSCLSYAVEGYDYTQISGGDATLSFWVKGAKTGTHCVSFRNSGGDRSYVNEYEISSANVWEKKVMTIPLTSTSGSWEYTDLTGLTISFALAVGSTFQITSGSWQTGNYLGTTSQVNECDNVANNFRIALVQLEKGDVATPYEYKNHSDELARCNSYYEEGSFQLFNQVPIRTTSRDTHHIGFVQTKRVAPTVQLYDDNGTVNKVTIYNSTSATTADNITMLVGNVTQGSFIGGKNQVTTSYGVKFTWTADAEL